MLSTPESGQFDVLVGPLLRILQRSIIFILLLGSVACSRSHFQISANSQPAELQLQTSLPFRCVVYGDSRFHDPKDTEAANPKARQTLVQGKRHWARIPKGLDILITHGPPFGILDVAPGSHVHEGDPELAEAVEMVEPRLHVFGHIHGARGMLRKERTTFVNAELYGEAGTMDKSPMIVEFEPARRS